MVILLTVAPALVEILHGKSEPSALRGELLGLPYGTGVAMIIWALAVVKAMAMAMKMALMEGMLMNERMTETRPASSVVVYA